MFQLFSVQIERERGKRKGALGRKGKKRKEIRARRENDTRNKKQKRSNLFLGEGEKSKVRAEAL